MAFQSTRPVWGATKVGTVYKTTGKVSIHAPRVGRDLGGDKAASLALFQSTRPVWGATYDCPRPPLSQSVSIHAPRVGRDENACALFLSLRFQSTRPVWGATCPFFVLTRYHKCFNPRAPCGARLRFSNQSASGIEFQSTRPVWGATKICYIKTKHYCVSIHAPRVGRDSSRYRTLVRYNVSIHAPRVGRDIRSLFLFTIIVCFNPRAPCGARRAIDTGFCTRRRRFNPRAPCGARRTPTATMSRIPLFQSTRPVWGATQQAGDSPQDQCVSIHAPRVGRDSLISIISPPLLVSIHAPRVGRDTLDLLHCAVRQSFNPRAPCGARQRESRKSSQSLSFQSTRPVWGATRRYRNIIHHLMFQSTRPVWGATISTTSPFTSIRVSIHAPRVGRDPI